MDVFARPLFHLWKYKIRSRLEFLDDEALKCGVFHGCFQTTDITGFRIHPKLVVNISLETAEHLIVGFHSSVGNAIQFSFAASTRPSSSTGMRSTSPAARSTASCSTALIMTRSAFVQEMASAMASLAPLVKMTSPSQSNAVAIRLRASSKAARAARPSPWGDEGFAQSAKALAMASRASGSIGMVAAVSR